MRSDEVEKEFKVPSFLVSLLQHTHISFMVIQGLSKEGMRVSVMGQVHSISTLFRKSVDEFKEATESGQSSYE